MEGEGRTLSLLLGGVPTIDTNPLTMFLTFIPTVFFLIVRVFNTIGYGAGFALTSDPTYLYLCKYFAWCIFLKVKHMSPKKSTLNHNSVSLKARSCGRSPIFSKFCTYYLFSKANHDTNCTSDILAMSR